MKVMAKSLVRNRHAVNKMFALKSQLQAVSLRIAVRRVATVHPGLCGRSGFPWDRPGWRRARVRMAGRSRAPAEGTGRGMSSSRRAAVPRRRRSSPSPCTHPLQTLKSTHAMADAMKGATRAMGMMNKRMNLPALAKVGRAAGFRGPHAGLGAGPRARGGAWR